VIRERSPKRKMITDPKPKSKSKSKSPVKAKETKTRKAVVKYVQKRVNTSRDFILKNIGNAYDKNAAL